MKCPRCGRRTNVGDTRDRGGGITYRNRLCYGCGLSFVTYEAERMTIAKTAPKLLEYIRMREDPGYISEEGQNEKISPKEKTEEDV